MKIKYTTTRKMLKDWGQIITDFYKESLLDKVSSGDLLNTMRFKVKANKKILAIEISLNEYWYYLEYGRKPGKFPPMDAMIRFIEEKPIFPEAYTLPSGREVVPSTMTLAFLIGRKIARDGIEGGHYFERTWKELEGDFKEELQEAIKADITLYFVDRLTNILKKA